MGAPASLVLRDIHATPAPSWWPPAPGWWIVAGIVVAAFALLAGWRLRARRRRDAIAALFDREVDAAPTPPQQIANRLRERARGAGRHGSCGMGIGECVGDSLARPDLTLYARDLADRATARRKLRAGLESKRAEIAPLYAHIRPDERHVFEDATWIDVALDVYEEVAGRARIVPDQRARQAIATSRRCVFEGAQGVLLDENHGFAPHTTWSVVPVPASTVQRESLSAFG